MCLAWFQEVTGTQGFAGCACLIVDSLTVQDAATSCSSSPGVFTRARATTRHATAGASHLSLRTARSHAFRREVRRSA